MPSIRGCGHARAFASSDLPRYGPPREILPVHMEVHLQPDLAQRSAQLRLNISLRCHSDGARTLALDAVDFLDLVAEATDGHSLDFHYDGTKLQLCWAEALHRGDQRQVAVRYRLERPTSGLHFCAPDEAYPERPSIVASDNETERARYWLACVDHPAVRSTFEWHLRGPADWHLLAGGLLVSEDSHEDGSKTAVWRLEQPCPPYLACIAMGDFVRVADESVDEIRIEYFGPKGTPEANLRESFGRTPAIMRWLVDKLAAPFPFPKYYQFAAPGIGGAMENISLTSWDDMWVLDASAASELGWLVDAINVHEMGHSYFGDALVIRHFSHAWLKESWATYLEALYMEDCVSLDAFRYEMLTNSRRYREEADGRYKRPIVTGTFDSSWDMFDAHLYPGGACRLDMLRRHLGDADFWQGVRAYVQEFSGKLVETKDFQQKLEEGSGRNLDWFFDQWFYRPDYPQLKMSFSYDKEKARGRLKLEQKQELPFQFELQLAVELKDGGWLHHSFQVKDKLHQLELAMAEPAQLQVDPESRLLHSQELECPEAMLRRTLSEAEHLSQRVWAAQHLARKGGKQNLEAIAAAYRTESHWGVRVELARHARAAAGPFVSTVLAGFLEFEQDPRALMDLVGFCDLRDPVLARALRSFLERPLAYRARAGALAALGSQRDAADYQLLLAASQDEGYQSLVRGGGFRGLGALRSEQGFEALLARLPYGIEPEKARRWVASALADAAPWLELRHRKQAAEALAALQREPECDSRTLHSSAAGLARLGVASAAHALETLCARLPQQDHAELRRKAAAVRAGLKPDGAVEKLKKEVSELKDKLRGALERLSLLESKAESGSAPGSEGSAAD